MNAATPTGTSTQITERFAQSTPGTCTVNVLGANIPNANNMIAAIATVETMARLETFPPIEPPIERPMNMANQYTAAINEATPAEMPTSLMRYLIM